MKTMRQKIEHYFMDLGDWIYGNRWKTLLIFVLLLTTVLSQIPKLKLEISVEGFFHKDDPALVAYEKFRDQFGRDTVAIIALEPDNIFSEEFFLKLKSLHEEIENTVPYVDEVTSLINATSIRGANDTLIVEDLTKNWPESEADFSRLKQKVLSNKLYQNFLISEDGRVTTIIVKSVAYLEDFDELATDTISNKPRKKLDDKENSIFTTAILNIVNKYRSKGITIHVAGDTLLNHTLLTDMQREAPRYTGASLLAILVLLFLLFRRVAGMLIPIFIILVSLLSTIGVMAIFGDPITMSTQILPTFILAVGVGDSVHLLAIFFREYQKTQDKRKSIVFAMGHSGLPILLTSLTTAGGLLSFANAELMVIGKLGVYAACGVVWAFAYTIVLTPLLISIFPLKVKAEKKTTTGALTAFDRLLVSMGEFSSQRAPIIIFGGIILMLIGMVGASKVKFAHDSVAWLPKDDPFRLATEYIDKNMKGSMPVEIFLDAEKENALYQPETMKKLDELNNKIEKMTEGVLYVGKSFSVVDTLKEIHQALNKNDEKFYVTPNDQKLIAQEFLLFENSGSDELEKLVDSQFSKARISLKLPWVDANAYARIITKIEAELDRTFNGTIQTNVTGLTTLMTRAIDALVHTMASSYLIAAIVISIMMIFLIGDVKIGLVSMIPNFLPILLALGVMGFTGMPIDMSNVTVGSIAIGLAVDDTMHFMHNFRRYHHQKDDTDKAIRQTFLTTGRAMVFTTIILCLSFLTYTISTLQNIVNFGLITALALVLALLSDLVLTPAILSVLVKKRV